MISNKHNLKIVIIQKTITIMCLVVSFACLATGHVYINGGGFGSSMQFEVPSWGGYTKLERELLLLSETLAVEDGCGRNLVEIEFAVLSDSVEVVEIGVADIDSSSDREVMVLDTAIGAVAVVRRPPLRATVADTSIAAIRSAVNSSDFDRALFLLRSQRDTEETVYLRARALMGLFLKGERNGSEVIMAWQQVKRLASSNTERYLQADSVLALFGQ